MAKIYTALIQKGLKTIDDVPARIRAEVEALSRTMSRVRLWLLDILMGKEKNGMAIVYATLIIKGKKTLEQVPAILREQVEQILEDLEVKL